MTTGIFEDEYNIAAKKIKLDNHILITNKDIEHKAKIKSIKLEPRNFNESWSYSHKSDYKIKTNTLVTDDSKKDYYISNQDQNCSSEKSNVDNCSHTRPSEALFVRCLLPHCKRLAPLWFKGVSSMREKNREDHRRISASTTCQNQNDWERISRSIKEMNESSETETVVNLLKKLYKELPSDSVLWFIKCWLKFPETISKKDKCVLSRGDARSRMRRIDGGKGSDKVWRLDTIVGMMFHGMPMSSTDTNIMVHTCENELCIRPQHLRFRASSVAFVAVLKALQQRGYTINPPADNLNSVNGGRSSLCDEFVDISGPFNIEQLQQYRLDEVKPHIESMGKLNSSSSDISLLDVYPILKNYYPTYGDSIQNEQLRMEINSTDNEFSHFKELKHPGKTSSNSTGSPPLIADGISHHCQSPPNLSSFKSVNTEIAPTPRKFEISHSSHLTNFKICDDSPSSSSMFSREREPFGQAPDLSSEEPYDVRHQVAMDVLSCTSRLTNESPLCCGSTNGSGKNTPRQPAKKRLEARTPTLLGDDFTDNRSSDSSPLDNKLVNSSSSSSAFRIVTKKNIINDNELTEVEVAKILDPCCAFPNGDYHPNGPFLSQMTNVNGKSTISTIGMPGNSKTNESLTTPSPFDYLLMAISQNSNLQAPDDQNLFPIPRTYSPAFSSQKPTSGPNDSTHGYRVPLKSSSSALSCRFTPEQASVLLNAIRNSPNVNNNPEIIDILFNMMQQYQCSGDSYNGDSNYRPDSCVLKHQIYQQLSKASPQPNSSCSQTPTPNEASYDNPGSMTNHFQSQLNKVIFNPLIASTINNTRTYSTDNN